MPRAFSRLRSFWRNSIAAAWNHPWARADRIGTFSRIVRWQVTARVSDGPHIVPWIGPSRLSAELGMHGLTGNIYYGLAEFADMGFLLHFLRSDDCLADIGANAGSYSVMAARLCGAHAIAFEPAAETWPALLRNIALNEIEGRVQAHQTALAANPGSAVMSTGQGSMNRLVEVDAGDVQEVALDTADAVLVSAGITAVKIDVEGAEEGVIEGAAELLRQPQLVAISIESLPGRTRDLIEQCGFREFFYDPHTREVTDRDPGLGANNHLFLRHESLAHVRERVAAAPAIRYGKLRLDRPDSV